MSAFFSFPAMMASLGRSVPTTQVSADLLQQAEERRAREDEEAKKKAEMPTQPAMTVEDVRAAKKKREEDQLRALLPQLPGPPQAPSYPSLPGPPQGGNSINLSKIGKFIGGLF